MTNEGPRRKRRRRERRAGARPSEVAIDSTPLRAEDEPWQWRTFPVFFAFALGALLMGMLIWIAPGAFYIFLVTAVFLSVFGVAHFFGRSFREYRDTDDTDEG
jgi:hypothetical protein